MLYIYAVVSFRGCAKAMSTILSETYDKHKIIDGCLCSA